MKTNMLTGNVWKSIFFFSIPIILESLFQQLYNTVDSILVGLFISKQALSAVGSSTGVIISLIVGLFAGLATGVTVNVSQLFGQNDEVHIKDTVNCGITIALINGVTITVIGIATAEYVLGVMHTPSDILAEALKYLRIYLLGLTPTLIYNTCAGILRAIGDSKRPLYFLVLSSVLNIALDIIFIMIFRFGVVGVAVSSVISQILGCVLICMYLNKKYNIRILLKGYIVKRILGIGLPAGLQSVMFSFTNIISQVYINKFGTDYVTAWTVYTKIGVVFFTIITAYGVAVTTFVGQNYGADRKERLWRGVKSGLCISYLSTIVISTIYLLFKRQLLMLFTRDENVLKLGAEVVKCIVPLYFTYVAMELLIGALKGLGKSFVPMCMTAFGVCFLRVVWLVFIQPKYNDFRMIVWSLPIGWIITSILIIAYYLFIKTKIRSGVKNEF